MRTLLTLLSAVLILLFYSCNKEDQVHSKLKGAWGLTEVRFSIDSVWNKDNKFFQETHRLNFLDCEKPYTASCPCIYEIDYSDENINDIVDTFYYELKGTELNASRFNTVTVQKIMRKRFKIQSYEGSELFLNREGLDTIQAYIKATRL